MKRGAEADNQYQRWKNAEGTDESFQTGLLLAENLFMRQTETPFALLIVNDRP